MEGNELIISSLGRGVRKSVGIGMGRSVGWKGYVARCVGSKVKGLMSVKKACLCRFVE